MDLTGSRILWDQTGSKVRPNWIKRYQKGLNSIKDDHIGSKRIKLNQTGSNWIKQDQFRSNSIKIDHVGSNGIRDNNATKMDLH